MANSLSRHFKIELVLGRQLVWGKAIQFVGLLDQLNSSCCGNSTNYGAADARRMKNRNTVIGQSRIFSNGKRERFGIQENNFNGAGSGAVDVNAMTVTLPITAPAARDESSARPARSFQSNWQSTTKNPD